MYLLKALKLFHFFEILLFLVLLLSPISLIFSNYHGHVFFVFLEFFVFLILLLLQLLVKYLFDINVPFLGSILFAFVIIISLLVSLISLLKKLSFKRLISFIILFYYSVSHPAHGFLNLGFSERPLICTLLLLSVKLYDVLLLKFLSL